MSASLTVIETAQSLPAALGLDLSAAVDLAKAEKALSTRKAYGRIFGSSRHGAMARAYP
jgi:hypothetical protein